MNGIRGRKRPARIARRAAVVLGLGVASTAGCRSAEPAGPPGGGDLRAALTQPAVSPPTRASRPAEPPGTGVRQAAAVEPSAPPADPAPAAPGPEAVVDLGVALRLAGVDNPTINLAREAVREALAGQLAARALLLPSVNVGGNFRRHRGALQAAPGFIRDVDSQSLYLGAGARATGTGTVTVPGVWLFAHLGDAAYEPLAARQRVAARQADARAVQNAVLRDVATAYLELVGAEARLDVLRRGEADVAEVVRLTAAYAQRGQGRQADADRAAVNDALVLAQRRRAEEDVAVASARLCRLLNLDPAVRLRGPGGPIAPVRLVPEAADPEPLVAAALRARPELAARSAAVLSAQTRVRQERVRPWLPLVSVGYSGGGFGGGSDLAATDFGPLKGRADFDAVAVWNLDGLGFGNRARVRRADAVVGEATAGYDAAVNAVRREVAEATAESAAAARQIDIAGDAVRAAEGGFGREKARIQQSLSRPIEVLDSFRQVLDARQELLRSVIAFDVAQFRLLVAVGNDPLAGPVPPPGP